MRRFQVSEAHACGRRCKSTGFSLFVRAQQVKSAPLTAESFISGQKNMKIMSQLWKKLSTREKSTYNTMAKKMPSARNKASMSNFNLLMRLFAKKDLFCTPGEEKLTAKIASSTALALSKSDEEKLRSVLNQATEANGAHVDRNYYKFSSPPMHLFSSFTEMQHSVMPTQKIAYALVVTNNKKAVSRSTFNYAAAKTFDRLPLDTRLLYTPITSAEAPHFEMFCSRHCGDFDYEKFNITALFAAFRGITRLPKSSSKQKVLYQKLMATDGVQEGVYFKTFRSLHNLRHMRSSDFGAYIYKNMKPNSKVPRSAYSLAHTTDDVAIARLLAQTRKNQCVYDDALQRAEVLRSNKNKELLSPYNVLKVLNEAEGAKAVQQKKNTVSEKEASVARKALTARQKRALLNARRAREARKGRDVKKVVRAVRETHKAEKIQHAQKAPPVVRETRRALTTRRALEARAAEAAKLAEEAQKALEARIAYEEQMEQTASKATAVTKARKSGRAEKAQKVKAALVAQKTRKTQGGQKVLETRATREAAELENIEKKTKAARAARSGRKAPTVRKSLEAVDEEEAALSVVSLTDTKQRTSGKLQAKGRKQVQKPTRSVAVKQQKVTAPPAVTATRKAKQTAAKAPFIAGAEFEEEDAEDFAGAEDELYGDDENEDMDDVLRAQMEKTLARSAKKNARIKVRQQPIAKVAKGARKTRPKKQPAVEDTALAAEPEQELQAKARPSRAAKIKVRQQPTAKAAKTTRKPRAKKQPVVEDSVVAAEAEKEIEATPRAQKATKIKVRQQPTARATKMARKTRPKKQPAVEDTVLAAEPEQELQAKARPSKAAKIKVRQQPTAKAAKMTRKPRAKKQPAVEDSVVAAESEKESVTADSPTKVRSANKRLRRMKKVLLAKPIEPIVDVKTVNAKGKQKKIKFKPNKNVSSVSLAIQKQLAGLL